MVSSGNPSFSIVSPAAILLLLAAHSLARPAFHVKVSEADIQAICSSTLNASFCSNLLKSNPKVGSADVPGLGGIVADIASANVANTSAYIQQLLKTATSKPKPGGGPSLRERYLTCAEIYDVASQVIEEIKIALSSKDYSTAQVKASALLDQPVTCNEELQPDPSQLSQRNQDLESIAGIILAITARLNGKID